MKIIDNRYSLIEKCKEAGLDAVHGDYFDISSSIPRAVLCTASNRSFTFGGGIDRQFLENFPYYCSLKQTRLGTNERIGNICFVISVDASIVSNEKLVREALEFAIKNTGKDETLCISGIGTMIGGLSEDIFTKIVKSLV